MNEINNNKTLIGLSKIEVYIELGNPARKYKDEYTDYYEYSAGTITNSFFFGEKTFYYLRIYFDENDKVKSTQLKMTD